MNIQAFSSNPSIKELTEPKELTERIQKLIENNSKSNKFDNTQILQLQELQENIKKLNSEELKTIFESIDSTLSSYENKFSQENNLLKQLYDKILNIKVSRLRISDDKKRKLENLISEKLEDELSAEKTAEGNSTIRETQ